MSGLFTTSGDMQTSSVRIIVGSTVGAIVIVILIAICVMVGNRTANRPPAAACLSGHNRLTPLPTDTAPPSYMSLTENAVTIVPVNVPTVQPGCPTKSPRYMEPPSYEETIATPI